MDKPFPAYAGDGPYVFVCYAHGDAKTVYPEIRWLRDQGVNIWYDEGISPGAEFPEYLGQAILGADLLLFYVSPKSAASRHCRDEMYFALDRGIPLLASYLAPTELPPGLALSMATTQGLLRHEMPLRDYRKKLLAGIAALLASRGVAAAAAARAAPSRLSWLRQRAVPLAAAVIVAVAAVTGFAVKQNLDRRAEIRWAKEELLPEIRSMVDARWSDFTEPYALAVKAEKIIPDDPELGKIIDVISLRMNIDSGPAGADVYMKEYGHPEREWSHVGVTPLAGLRVPVGIFRWKFEKDGYETVLATASSWDIKLGGDELMVPGKLRRQLDRRSEIPDGMVRVAGTETPHGRVADFFIDRYEVTNADFHKFVAAGGYRDRKYWQHEFEDDGRVLSWEEGIARFVDQTGRAGPATWIGGIYPDGRARHPVSVSWYEAAAYAEFVGRSLPTGTHWGIARGEYLPLIRWPQLGGYAVLAPYSNFGGTGTVEVGSLPGITAFGAYDLAGNVKEWCSNDTSRGKLVRGGAWNDNTYRFAALSQAPPMFREAEYGFRTAFYPEGKEPAAAFAAASIMPPPDLPPQIVSDEVFDAYTRQFSYDAVELNARQESLDDSAELWTLERVSVDTPYDDERMIVNLFLPKGTPPPFQTVIYFPGSASLFQTSSENIDEYYEFPVFLSFLVKTGRAVAYPVYDGTFERSGSQFPALHAGPKTHAYTAYVARLVKDFGRTIDYLETREDIDSDRLAYYGMSWGAMLGTIIPAIEHRLTTSIILAGGLEDYGLPEANPINYAPRITMPYLMLVGRYDSILEFEAAAKPLFDLIGTAAEHKVMKVYDTDHIPPKSEYIAEILSWLDTYLGPVQQPVARSGE